MPRLPGLFAAAILTTFVAPAVAPVMWSGPALAETPPASSALPPAPAMTAPAAQRPAAEAVPAPAAPVTTGFRVVAVEVVAERDSPQACFTLSAPLDKGQGRRYAAYVEVSPVPPAAAPTVVARDRTLCVDGLVHGNAYTITLTEGMPGSDGLKLAATERHAITVPNRTPSLAFRGAGYILPRVGPEGLPLRSINVDHARLRVLQMADRKLVEKIYAGRISQTISDWDIGEMVEKTGTPVWQGALAIEANRNLPVVTPFPISEAKAKLGHGVFLALAEAGDKPSAASHDSRASQWFVVSDLGLTSLMGDDGLIVFARSLGSAAPQAGVELHLLARNGQELAQRVTGADGIARFEAAIARKDGDDSAQALFAYGAAGDFSFLDLAAPDFDLTDRGGSSGRASPGPLDAFLYTDRGIYRASETIALTALIRDSNAQAVAKQHLTVRLIRPDGFEADRRVFDDSGAGAISGNFVLPTSALPGTWVLTAHASPDGPVIGRSEFTVLDFQAPRLDIALSSSQPTLTDAPGPTSLTVDARYLFGATAAGLPGELSLTLRPAEAPFPGYAGFRFGLAQEKFAPTRSELPGFTTNGAGKATIELPALKIPDSTHPLEAVIRGSVIDVGGRPVSRELVLPVRHQPFAIGVRPRFDNGGVPEGATASFEVIALAADGSAIDKPDLSYELYEEESDYRWFEANGHWDYETVVRDHRVTGGTLTVVAGTPAVLEETVAAGRYRLELFDAKSGVATSTRFAAGWWVAPSAGNRPDKVDVSVMLPSYRGGDIAKVHIRPPYDSQVVIAVADRSVRTILSQTVSAQGAFLDIPVDPSWTNGVTIIATAYAPLDLGSTAPPRRAIGVGWLAVDNAPHQLGLKLALPQTSEPRQTVTVGVKVTDAVGAPLPANSTAYLTLTAVDDTVLQLTEQTTPDPVAYYLGKRRLGVALRDIFGRLLETAGNPNQAATRPGAADKDRDRDRKRLRQVPALPERDSPVTALYSGIVRIGPDGKAEVPLALPDFNGRLRLAAVAWTESRLGRAEAELTVRDKVEAVLNLPRFLAPGDHARLSLQLTNLSGANGDYQVTLSTEGGLSLGEGATGVLSLKRGRHAAIHPLLIGDSAGNGVLRLEITGPDGFHLVRSRSLVIRAPEALEWRHSAAPLPVDQVVTLPAELTAGLRPETLTAALSISPLPEFDLPGQVMTVDRRLRGNTEQLAAGAWRLVTGGSVALAIGLDNTASLTERTQSTLDLLLALQRVDGGFAQWSATGEADPWLTAFVADLLGRAREAGYRVPDTALRLSLDWLKAMLDNGWFEDRELPGRAYATYVLARAHQLDLGAVQYSEATYGAKLGATLSRVLLAAAMATLGDTHSAAELMIRLANGNAKDADHPMAVRDLAGLVALGAESGALNGEPLLAAAERLATLSTRASTLTSGQDRAWLTLAATALARRAPTLPPTRLSEGERLVDVPHATYRRFDPAALPVLRNAGPGPLNQVISVTGLSSTPTTSAENGFSINRTIYSMTGTPVKAGAIHQNEVVVVIIEGRSLEPRRQQVIVTDLLPAGLVIETVRLADSAQLGALSWLGELSAARHVDYRADRFLAALDLDESRPKFRVVYLARAAIPGDFIEPGVRIEAASDPSRFARTATDRLEIQGEKIEKE